MTRVAFQGEAGAYSEEAVVRYFGEDAEPVPCRSFQEVGDAVMAGRVERGLLPIENTIAGSVTASYDVLASMEITVVGEVILPIRHCLLGVPGASRRTLSRILSHPVALAQCTRFLSARPDTEAVAVYDTAGAAKEVAAAGDPSVAAIASRRAAARYGLEVLATGLEDRGDNQTRFLAVAPGRAALCSHGAVSDRDPGEMKVALRVETDNAPGALVSVLQPFADRQINLSKLEARPAAEPWCYRFFIEIEACAGAGSVREALAEVRDRVRVLDLLGCFRRWR